MKVDIVLFGLVTKILHLRSAIVVQVALVSNKDLNRVSGADTFYTFVVVRNTFERRGKVNCVHDNDSVCAMQEVCGYLLLGSLASRVPNIQLDLLWLTVLAVAWHLHNLVIVLDSDGRLMFGESVRYELMDDGSHTDARIANQNDFPFRYFRYVNCFKVLSLFVL